MGGVRGSTGPRKVTTWPEDTVTPKAIWRTLAYLAVLGAGVAASLGWLDLLVQGKVAIRKLSTQHS